jgi:hypothetical protein
MTRPTGLHRAFVVVLFAASVTAHAQTPTPTEGWSLFSTVKFKTELFKEYGLYLQVPIVDQKLTALIGKEVILSGHYLPLEMQGNSIILSKYPYASCFFCGGGGGPESVSEIVFAGKPPAFEPDQWITVRGKLRVNSLDIDRMNFIVENAVLVKEK